MSIQFINYNLEKFLPDLFQLFSNLYCAVEGPFIFEFELGSSCRNKKKKEKKKQSRMMDNQKIKLYC
jgi:hypothetical protein